MDQTWFRYLNGLPASVPGLGPLAVWGAKFGLLAYAGLAAWLWWRGSGASDERRKVLLLALFAAGLALGVNAVVNAAVPRPRPFLVVPARVLLASPPHDPSFPSDHAAVSAAIAVALVLGGQPGWGALAFLGSCLIGLARVVVGVHYPSDIAGGITVGATCAAAAIWLRTALDPVLTLVLATARRLHLG